MYTRRATFAAVLLGALTACGSSGEPETITVTETVTATPEADTQAKAAADDDVLKIGSKKDIVEEENDLHISVQAVEYQQPYKGPQPGAPEDFQGGDVWAAAEVKICNVAGADVGVSQFPWSLAYEDGTVIDVTGSSGGDMPKPEFPMDKTLKPDRCAAGLIAFPVPGDKTPEYLVYEPEGGDPTEWAITQS
ncbi:DUF4352 domain-containing protein [Streptomyces sp. CRN 30]|uniref:DUF4352 domain-containing protein n=1 Tax=Streptomyces sp. CRN 30 TaxID=3075613 RepID=UPI002A7EFEC4|nr:DUF4352 domain-containing protein [Streptomyces sp. CRN 30]